MGISRKDTIIIAVLVNVALLATLFSLGRERKMEKAQDLVIKKEKIIKQTPKILSRNEKNTPSQPVDEIDAVLLEYEKMQASSSNKKANNQLDTEVQKKSSKSKEPVDDESKEYYVIQNGDNPWKIAKKFQLKYEDLLTLNGLDEDKARQLKIGQKIRIR